MITEKTFRAFRKVAARCAGLGTAVEYARTGTTRTTITFARKMKVAGLVYFSEASRYRREEWGRPVGPVFVSVSLTDLGEQVACAGFSFHQEVQP